MIIWFIPLILKTINLLHTCNYNWLIVIRRVFSLFYQAHFDFDHRWRRLLKSQMAEGMHFFLFYYKNIHSIMLRAWMALHIFLNMRLFICSRYIWSVIDYIVPWTQSGYLIGGGRFVCLWYSFEWNSWVSENMKKINPSRMVVFQLLLIFKYFGTRF